MSRHDSRERAARAATLRALQYSWRDVCSELGYRSVGAAQLAVKGHYQRNPGDPCEVTQRNLLEQTRVTSRALLSRFAAAAERRDDDTLAMLNRELVRNRDQIAKLTGAYAPDRQQVDVSVSADPAAIIARAEADLLALVEQRQLPGTIIDVETEEIPR
ncbi:hypothetical protein ACDT10_01935 [Mycobacterium intracellulare]|uniref:hypothetical protein n=1 Tax=Mycobacterium intracellulare TaxID=1767 RepID=UPI0035569370